VHPPTAVLVFQFPPFNAAANGPIEKIDDGSQRTDITTKTSRNDQADSEDDRSRRKETKPNSSRRWPWKD
jgi:hypothetical protein